MNALGNLISSAVFALLGVVPPLAQPNQGVEPLARGPIHEAFANPIDSSAAPAQLIDQEPPAPIEELPAEQKPDDPNVQWIPGYWAWDDARGDFLWVSGFWRVPPPGRVWVPGRWEQVANGWRWVPGFWVTPEQPALTYLPPPPESIESGPSVPAPSEEHIYVPGTWVYTASRYVWRPGSWVVFRPGWVWIPACYRWTPAGHVFIDGYWDFPLARRGILFSPVWINRRFCYRPRWFYSPTFAIYDDALYGALFVRPGCSHYFFGDYFDTQFTRIGYRSWFSVSFGRGFTYDPLWSYYQLHYRRDPFWAPAIREVYTARFAGHLPRPPVTIINQVNQTVVNNVTNVNIINNPTIINNYKNIIKSTNINNVTNVNNTVVNIRQINKNKLTQQISENETLAKFQNLKPVPAHQRHDLVRDSKQIKDLAKQRSDLEGKLLGSTAGSKPSAPKTLKLELPKNLTAPTVTKPNITPPPPAVERPKLPSIPNIANKPGNPEPNKPNTNRPALPNIERPKLPSLPNKPSNPEPNKPTINRPALPNIERPKLPSIPQKPGNPELNKPNPNRPALANIEPPKSANTLNLPDLHLTRPSPPTNDGIKASGLRSGPNKTPRGSAVPGLGQPKIPESPRQKSGVTKPDRAPQLNEKAANPSRSGLPDNPGPLNPGTASREPSKVLGRGSDRPEIPGARPKVPAKPK